MGRVRPFVRGDIPQLVRLHPIAFGERSSVSGDDFDEVFLKNPWYDPSMPSLVYEESSGRISGFMGVVPRPFLLKGQLIQVAIASHLMVDPACPSITAGLRLFKRYLDGPQDLSCADYVNGKARKIWELFHGDTVWVRSVRWRFVLRPFCTRRIRSLLKPWRYRSFTANAVNRFCAAVNVCENRIRGLKSRLATRGVTEVEIDEEAILSSFSELSAHRPLRPVYNLESLKWLLKRAAAETRHGALQKIGVRDSAGQIIGYYVYYLRPGGESRVLQFVGRRGCIADVLGALLFRAWRGQADALSGWLDCSLLDAAATSSGMRCSLASHWMMVCGKDQAALSPIHRGDAFFTDLDGEWLLRFPGEVQS